MPSAQKKKRLRREQSRVWRTIRIALLLLFLLSSVLLFLFSYPSFSIRELRFRSNDSYGEERVAEYVEEHYLHRYFFSLIPGDNRFLLKLFLQRDLEEQFPEYAFSRFSLDGGDFVIRFKRRERDSLWCEEREGSEQEESSFEQGEQEEGEEEALKSGQQEGKGKGEEGNNFPEREEVCYFVDSRAFPFAKAPSVSDGMLLKWFHQGEEIELGKTLIDPERYNRLKELIQRISSEESISGEVWNIILSQDLETERKELVLIVSRLYGKKLDHPIRILMREPENEEELDFILQELMLLRDVPLFKREFFREEKGIAYIDLRFPDQIRYRLLEEELGSTQHGEKEATTG